MIKPDDITLRDGTEDDVPWMLELAKRTVKDSISSMRVNPTPGYAEAAVERLIRLGLTNKAHVIVAETPLERIGFCEYMQQVFDEVSGEPQAFGVYISVEPYARRSGVAKMLMLKAEEIGVAAGARYCQFVVTEDNVAARQLYAEMGYQTERRVLCKRF